MIGRKPKHSFNNLEIGEKTKLKGKAAKYPHQFANQYNKKDDKKVRVIKDGKNFFIERIL